MERTMRVTGKGTLSVRPDTMRLLLSVEGVEEDYAEALSASADVTNELRGILHKFGFMSEDLKTLHFDIDSEYEGYRDKNNDYKKRFVGYKYVHRMKLDFPMDNKRLGKVLYALGRSALNPELTLRYTVADPEATKNQLLAKAVADSRSKASILADASDVELGHIITIDYSWSEMEVVARGGYGVCAPTKACDFSDRSYDIEIEPDDIKLEDTVTVIWEIK